MAVDLTKPPRPPSDMADKFMLRMPDGMRDRIAEEAASNGRSMNAEIVVRLRRTFTARIGDDLAADLDAAMNNASSDLEPLVTLLNRQTREHDAAVGAIIGAMRLKAQQIQQRQGLLPHRDDPEGAN